MRTMINIKADQDVKRSAKRIAEELGLSLSAVINAYLKQFIRNKAVYFSSMPQMSPELEKLLGGVEKDLHRKRNISSSLKSLREVRSYLDSL